MTAGRRTQFLRCTEISADLYIQCTRIPGDGCIQMSADSKVNSTDWWTQKPLDNCTQKFECGRSLISEDLRTLMWQMLSNIHREIYIKSLDMVWHKCCQLISAYRYTDMSADRYADMPVDGYTDMSTER